MPRMRWWTICVLLGSVARFAVSQATGDQSQLTWQAAVLRAKRVSPSARIVVLDLPQGHLLASSHLAAAARTLAPPGSLLKPLFLYSLIYEGRWDPRQRIACTRGLRIAGRPMSCSHPASSLINATNALALSCNTYFARVASTLRPDELREILSPTGLLSITGLVNGEVAAEMHDPQTVEQTELTVLGVTGVRVTPLEVAAAYRWLAVRMAADPDSTATLTVHAGLIEAVQYGTAAGAAPTGMALAGKTGTAGGPGAQSHGWFAGLAPGESPKIAFAIYLPAGRGSDAAKVAAALLRASPLRQR